jgi:hypothetical protein
MNIFVSLFLILLVSGLTPALIVALGTAWFRWRLKVFVVEFPPLIPQLKRATIYGLVGSVTTIVIAGILAKHIN